MYSYKIIDPEKEVTEDGGAVVKFAALEIYKDDVLIDTVENERFSEPSSVGKYVEDKIKVLEAPTVQQTKIDEFLLAAPTDVINLEKPQPTPEEVAKADYLLAKYKLDTFYDLFKKGVIKIDDPIYVEAQQAVKDKFKVEYI